MIELTRSYRFPAAHLLAREDLSQAENERLYGKCANPAGHGHNYEVEVTVEGPVDERSGLVVVRDELDAVLDRHLVSRCDHRDLDRVIGPEQVSTGENLARIFFSWVEPHVPAPAR